jgi:antitoxin component YwqK of YwqJK toxin-antitoxin module
MRVGGSIINVLHIARIEGTSDKHSINTYVAGFRRPGEQPDWYADDMVEFEHQYGNGIEELVRRALNAIKENNELG